MMVSSARRQRRPDAGARQHARHGALVVGKAVDSRRPRAGGHHLLDVGGDILEGREPHPARVLHVLDQRGHGIRPRHPAGHEGVPDAHPDAAVLVGGIELRLEHLRRPLRRGDRQHVTELLQTDVLGPVVERDVGGQLHQGPRAVGQQVWHVVAEERRVVLDALVEQDAERVAGDGVGRGAEPARRPPRGAGDGLDAALERGALVVPRAAR